MDLEYSEQYTELALVRKKTGILEKLSKDDELRHVWVLRIRWRCEHLQNFSSRLVRGISVATGQLHT